MFVNPCFACVCVVQRECCCVAVNEWGEKHSLVSANSRGVKCWLDMMYAGTEGVVIRRKGQGKTLSLLVNEKE